MKERMIVYLKPVTSATLSRAFKRSLVLVISAVLVLQTGFANRTSTVSATSIDRRSLAGLYTQAVRDIGSIGSMSIRSEADVKRAISIIRAAKGKLRQGLYSHLIMTAAESSSFKQALINKLQAEAAKPEFAKLTRAQIGKQFFQTKIRSNSRAFYNSDLGRQATTAIRNKAREDAAAFDRAARNLEDSLAKLKPRAQMESDKDRSALAVKRVSYASPGANRPAVPTYASAFTEPASPAFVQGWEEILIGALIAAVVVVIAAWGAAKAEDFGEEDNPDPDGGKRTDFEKCMDEADSKADRCEDRCNNDWWCEAGCDAKWLAATGVCILLPQ